MADYRVKFAEKETCRKAIDLLDRHGISHHQKDPGKQPKKGFRIDQKDLDQVKNLLQEAGLEPLLISAVDPTSLRSTESVSEQKNPVQNTPAPNSLEAKIERLLQKFDAGEELSEQELKYLVYYGKEVSKEYGENSRWTRPVDSVIQINNRYLLIYWEEGLTECQESEFWEQPKEVIPHDYEKTITVREWLPITQKESQKEESDCEEERE